MYKYRPMSLTMLEQHQDLFWSKVDVTNDCWDWMPIAGPAGYGVFRKAQNGIRYWVRTHRAAFMLQHNSTIPEGYCILHHCDRPICVKPEHLFLGLPKDNSIDMVKKNRAAHNIGSKHGQSKLRESDVVVRNRLSRGESSTIIAKDFPVSARMIRRIRSGENWTHIGVSYE